MGSAESKPRRLTLENEESASVIKVSDDVVKRIKSAEKIPPPVSNSIISTHQLPTAQGGVPIGIPPPPYFYDPNLTYLKIQEEKCAALKQNDMYWERRVADLEKAHGQMHNVMEKEFIKAIEENTDKTDDSPKCITPPCQNRKRAVMECYQNNPREPMRCFKEVEAFAECVDMERATLVSNRS